MFVSFKDMRQINKINIFVSCQKKAKDMGYLRDNENIKNEILPQFDASKNNHSLKFVLAYVWR